MPHSFYMPVKIISGENCVMQSAGEFKKLGNKAYIVTSPSSSRNGALEDVTAALESQGIAYGIFDRCENNPSIARTNEMGAEVFASGCDFIIGIGGGSAMDSAKAASVLAVNRMDAAELFKNVYPVAPLPLVEVPTTAGTGSEVTYNAVLTVDGGKNKKSFGDARLHARLALLDARYTEKLPMRLARNTAVDALAHALEGYLSTKATPMGTLFAREVFRIFAKNHDALLGESLTLVQREELLLNAAYAGIVIAQERTLALHTISYPLTAIKGVQHGAAVGLPMAAYVELCYPGAKERIDEMLHIMGLSSVNELYGYIGCLLADENTYTEEELQEFAAISGKAAAAKSNPVPVDHEAVLWMYRRSLNMEK